MKKNIFGLLLSIAILGLLQVEPVYADVITWEGITVIDDDEDSVLLPGDVRHSRDVEYRGTKGSIISAASADITNEGGGKIGVLMETLAHVPCDKIRQVVYLDVWNDTLQDWVQLERFEFIETKEDHPGEELTSLMRGFTITGYPIDYYYRVRGLHGVWLNGEGESFATRTDGVLITK